MKKLYKFCLDCGRQGKVESIFIAEDYIVNATIGMDLYFGEILGKHSDIDGVFESIDIKELDISEETVTELERVLGKTISGHNPLKNISDYTYCYNCDSELEIAADNIYIDEHYNIVCPSCLTEEEKEKFKMYKL